jgi:hypothetical protein
MSEVRYEAMVRCPNTKALVPTGYFLDSPSFKPHERRYGIFTCPSCGETHHWDSASAQIAESAR